MVRTTCSIKERMMKVGVVKYALFAYVLTAVISFAVVTLIVVVNNIMNRKNGNGEVQ